MQIPLYQVDAFTADIFSGNPAAVCLLERWPGDDLLQAIAAENNLSETAFLVCSATGFDIRWFTPVTEVALCGHATLASAFVLFTCRQWPGPFVRFETRQSGTLRVFRCGDLLEMDFPARPAHRRTVPPGLWEALGVLPGSVFGSAEDLLVVLESEAAVRAVRPDFTALAKLDCRGVIVTAPGERCDFVSRFFAPRVGVTEDPVTGSAHCVLVPYWAAILGRDTLQAQQVSARGGELFCRNEGSRVSIAGRAALYLTGTITIGSSGG
jgi:predicted PhzF superfamily epimerase YddE/YHI9